MTDHKAARIRTNRVFKSLHKPLTYLGVERTLFYLVCVAAVGAFNLFDSHPCWYWPSLSAALLSDTGLQTATPPFSASSPNPSATSFATTLPSSRSRVWRSAEMLRLDKVIKPWKDAAALNDHINLYGFWNETTFLTKSGDLGMVLSVPGVDYESLDRAAQEYASQAAGSGPESVSSPGFHVYQYLFKSNRPEHTVRPLRGPDCGSCCRAAPPVL